MTADVDVRKENKKKQRHSKFMNIWRGMLDTSDNVMVGERPKHRFTKPPVNKSRANMRRKMAKRSRRINRRKKGKRKMK